MAEFRDIATIIGVVVGVVALIFTAINTRLTLRTNRARFWLDLRDQFGKHDEVHRRLRPGGAWAEGAGPETPEQWAQLEAYMGLFEHGEAMLQEGLIDQKTFKEIYEYRLKNIVRNDVIKKEKLVKLKEGWKRFLALLARMDIRITE